MGQPRIIEVEYREFLGIYRRATDSNKKIDMSDRERWNKYVRDHKVPDAAMAVRAQAGAMSGKIKTIIVDGIGKADGYYAYAPDDRFCVKYDLGLD